MCSEEFDFFYKKNYIFYLKIMPLEKEKITNLNSFFFNSFFVVENETKWIECPSVFV